VTADSLRLMVDSLHAELVAGSTDLAALREVAGATAERGQLVVTQPIPCQPTPGEVLEIVLEIVRIGLHRVRRAPLIGQVRQELLDRNVSTSS
jgi:hypothetical protein